MTTPARPMRVFAEGLSWVDRYREGTAETMLNLAPLPSEAVCAFAYAQGYRSGQESITKRFVGCADAMSSAEIWDRFQAAIAEAGDPVDRPAVRPDPAIEASRNRLDLDAAKKLCAAASPGPWRFEIDRFDDESYEAIVDDAAVSFMARIDTEVAPHEAIGDDWTEHDSAARDAQYARAKASQAASNAALMAAARMLVPELIAEVERLRALLETPR